MLGLLNNIMEYSSDAREAQKVINGILSDPSGRTKPQFNPLNLFRNCTYIRYIYLYEGERTLSEIDIIATVLELRPGNTVNEHQIKSARLQFGGA